jgi:hypothetical protein
MGGFRAAVFEDALRIARKPGLFGGMVAAGLCVSALSQTDGCEADCQQCETTSTVW